MQKNTKIVTLLVLIGLFFGVIDVWVDSTVFFEGSFLDLLFYNVPKHELFMRSLLFLMLIVLGFVVLRVVGQENLAHKAKTVSELELNKLIESTAAVPWKVDAVTQKFTYVGDQIEKITGYPATDWVDFDFWASKIHPDDREFAVNFCITATGNGADHEFVYRLIRADNKIVWLRDLVYVESVNGEPRFLRGFFFDISRAMEIEAENKKLEAQLRHSQKMEALGQLAGGVAHDFNNFLTTIVGYGELNLLTMQDNDPQRENTVEIIKAANSAASVTKSLLAFSRKQDLDPQPLDVNAVVTGMRKMLVRLLGANIKLKIKMPDRSIIVKADTGQLEQVIINMAANAKAAIQHNGTFTIETSKITIDENDLKAFGLAQAGEYANILFSDNGAGMAAETLEKIFEPFYTTKDKDHGTGLGLAIVHGIIKQHNGYISAYSEKGYGTTFKILLPCTKSPVLVAAKRKAPQIGGGNETILIAEDEASVRKLLSEILRSSGYNVILAKDGLEAVNKFNTHRERIKLAILDVVMPGQNGNEVLAGIRQTAPNFRALFISGYAKDTVRSKGLIPNDTDFLSKPILPNEFLYRVREILDRSV